MWELTECRGKGEGYFPLRDGLFRRYVPSFQPLLDNYRGWVEYTFSTDKTGTVIFKNAAGVQTREETEKPDTDKLEGSGIGFRYGSSCLHVFAAF